jgi:hypothetical protein
MLPLTYKQVQSRLVPGGGVQLVVRGSKYGQLCMLRYVQSTDEASAAGQALLDKVLVSQPHQAVVRGMICAVPPLDSKGACKASHLCSQPCNVMYYLCTPALHAECGASAKLTW